MTQGICNGCGKCCYYPSGRQGELLKCPHLIKTKTRYVCRIYNNRLGKVIGRDIHGKDYVCSMYNALQDEIDGCPLNLGTKPTRIVDLHKDYKGASEVKLYEMSFL